MVFMQAAEKDGIRVIRHTTEDADIADIMSCIKALTKAASEAKGVLPQAFEQALTDVDNDK